MKFKTLISAALLSTCVSAQAAIVVTGESSATPLAYAVLAGDADLINAGQPTLSNATVSATHTAFPGTGINDGKYSNTLADNTFFQTEAQYPATATYDLDVSVNVEGYEIISIDTFMGWAGGASSLADQTYTVEVRSVGSTNYVQIAAVNYLWDTELGGTTRETHVEISNDSTGILASGVDSIRFVFSAGAVIGTLVREIDVHATSSKSAVNIAGGATFSSTIYSIGWRFTPTTNITVTALGVYDIDGGGLSSNHTVRLYNQTANTVVTNMVIPQAAPGEAAGEFNAHYVAVTPFVLSAGDTYLIARNQGPDSYQYDTAITAGAELGFVTGVAVAGNLPASASSFSIERADSYFGPNFKYEYEYAAGEPQSFTVDMPKTRAVYQRGTNNTASVSVTGSCVAGADTIEVRAVTRAGYKGTDMDWTTLATSPGTSYSNTVELAGGWYDIEVRVMKDGVGIATSRVERVGVGEIVITCGQSNSANYGGPKQTPTDDRVNAFNLATMSWQLAADPQPYAGGTGGSAWPDFGDLLAARTEVPVAVIALGIGSTRVEAWLPGGNYSKILTAMNAMKPYGGFRAILWHQGESDSLVGTTAANYESRLNTIITQSRTDAGFTVPWGVALASWHPTSSASNEAMVFAGQQLVISNTAGVFQGPETDSFHTNPEGWLNDAVHFNDLGLRDHGRQWVDAVCGELLSGDRDDDGMPDLWMLMHFGHATGSADDNSRATDDADGDGVSNLDEYRATTDPKNMNARLKLDRIDILTNATVRVTWPAVAGRTYRIRSTGDLSSPLAWDSSTALHSYGSSMVYEESLAVTTRFFRVQAE